MLGKRIGIVLAVIVRKDVVAQYLKRATKCREYAKGPPDSASNQTSRLDRMPGI